MLTIPLTKVSQVKMGILIQLIICKIIVVGHHYLTKEAT